MIPHNSCVRLQPQLSCLCRCLHRTRKAVTVPSAYFPHHRVHITSSGRPLPRLAQRRLPLPAPEPELAGPVSQSTAIQQITDWLCAGQIQQQLAAAGPVLLQQATQQLQSLCHVLANGYQQAQAAWKYILACWPAWKASLQEDVELLFEYALGLIPAWLAYARAGIVRLCLQATASTPVRQLAASTAVAMQQMGTGVHRVRQVVMANAKLPTPRLPLPAALMRAGRAIASHSSHQAAALSSSSSSGHSGSDIARGAAHSLFFFGGLGGANRQQQQEAGGPWLQQQAEYQCQARPRRWKLPQRREWANGVVKRAMQRSSIRDELAQQRLFTKQLQGQRQSAAGGHLGIIPEAVQSAAGHLQGRIVAAVASSHAAASRGAQQCFRTLVTPLQHAGLVKPSGAPTLMGTAVAASVVLTGAVWRGLQYHQQMAAQQAAQKQQLVQRAESLQAQKARIRGALHSNPDTAGVASRRKTAVPSPQTAAGALDAEAALAAAAAVADPADAADISAPALDGEVAQDWAKFLASARALDVPMWDNRMVEELPKISKREAERQTQKIRSAARPEEQAALAEADMQQLNRQLQQLIDAPMGRAARAAWRKEQKQHKQTEQQPGQQGDTARDSPSSRWRSGSPNSNPFAISSEVRARWQAEEEEEAGVGGGVGAASAATAKATPANNRPQAASSGSSGSNNGHASAVRAEGATKWKAESKPQPDAAAVEGAAARAQESAAASASISSSSSGGSTASSSSSNPFAISSEARAKWESEDYLYSEPETKPLQKGPATGLLGGLFSIFKSEDEEQPAPMQRQHRQQQPQRPAAVRQQLLQQQRSTDNRGGEPAAATSRSKVTPGSPAAAGQQSMSAASRGLAGGEQVTASSAAGDGDSAVDEDSPEYRAMLRARMMQSGAARRARMQQMQQQSQANSSQKLQSSVQQPKPSSPTNSSQSGSSLASVVSIKDAQSITAPVRSVSSSEGALSSSAAQTAMGAMPSPPAGAAAAVGAEQQQEKHNPFAVDRTVALSDEIAFELWQEIDEETSRIRLER